MILIKLELSLKNLRKYLRRKKLFICLSVSFLIWIVLLENNSKKIIRDLVMSYLFATWFTMRSSDFLFCPLRDFSSMKIHLFHYIFFLKCSSEIKSSKGEIIIFNQNLSFINKSRQAFNDGYEKMVRSTINLLDQWMEREKRE